MAEVAVKFTGDPAAMQRALDAVIRNQERMEQGFKRIKGEGKHAENDIVGGMRHLALELFSVHKAVELVGEAFGELRKIESEAGKALSDEAFGTRTLAQIARTTAEFAKLKEQVDEVSGGFGLGKTASQKLVFDAAVAGLSDADRKAFAETTKLGVDPSAMMESAVRIHGAYGGGVSRRDINEALAAGAGTLTKAEDIGTLFAGASTEFAGAGISKEAGLAIAGELSKVTRNPRAAAGMMKALAETLSKYKDQLSPAAQIGSPFQQAAEIADLAEHGKLYEEAELYDPKHPRRLLKRKLAELGPEAAAALRAVNLNRDAGITRTGDIYRAGRGTGEGDLLAGKLSMVGADTGLSAELSDRKAKEKLEKLRIEKYGGWNKLADAVMTEEERLTEVNFGKGFFGRMGIGLSHAAEKAGRFFVGDQAYVETALRPENRNVINESPDIGELRATFEALNSTTENLNDAARTMRGGPTMAPDPHSEK